jgi:hypothetical protein
MCSPRNRCEVIRWPSLLAPTRLRFNGVVRFGSRLGHSGVVPAWAAVPPIADMSRAECRAASCQQQKSLASFDHFVGSDLRVNGAVKPSAMAIFRLMTKSSLVLTCKHRSI